MIVAGLLLGCPATRLPGARLPPTSRLASGQSIHCQQAKTTLHASLISAQSISLLLEAASGFKPLNMPWQFLPGLGARYHSLPGCQQSPRGIFCGVAVSTLGCSEFMDPSVDKHGANCFQRSRSDPRLFHFIGSISRLPRTPSVKRYCDIFSDRGSGR